MANWNPPNKNEAFEFDVCLEDWANPGLFKSNPTLAAGDAKHSGDGAALANLATLPAVTPASSKIVRVQLSQSEMNYDKVVIILSDQTSPPEWADYAITILTTTP